MHSAVPYAPGERKSQRAVPAWRPLSRPPELHTPLNMNSIFAVSAALAAIEAKALQALATHGGPLGQQLTTSKALSVSPLYSGVIAVNVVGGSMAMLTLSMKVGQVCPRCAPGAPELAPLTPCAAQARKKYGVEYPTMCVPCPVGELRPAAAVAASAKRSDSATHN